MALKYGFFNSLNGDRKYNAEDIGRFLHGLISGGVYADRSDSLQVFVDNDMTVAVQPGRGMFDFHYLENDAVMYLTLATGNTLPRYDAVIAKLDYNNRQITIEVKQGAAASTPVKPAMTRTETIKEYCLAYIYVDKLATTISQGNITDARPDTDVCGFVTGIIDQVDTKTLWAQLEADFNAWFDTMKDQLSEDAAGNLQLQIDTVKETADNAMPKAGGKYTGNVIHNASLNEYFETLNGYKFRIGTGTTDDTVYLQAVDSTNKWIADIIKFNAATGEITGGQLMSKSGDTFTGNSKASDNNTQGYYLRNIAVTNSALSTYMNTGKIVFTRK